MPDGDAFTERQEQEIARALRVAREESGLHFSVFAGAAEGEPRAYAERLHAALGPAAPSATRHDGGSTTGAPPWPPCR